MRENCLENFPGKKSNSIVSTFARNAGQSTRLVTREFKRFRFNTAKIESRESPDLLLISRSTIHKTFSLAPFNFHIPWRICIYMPAKSRKDSVFKSNDNRSLARSQSATQRREFKSSWNTFPTQLVVFPPRFNYSSTSTLNSLSFSLSDRGLHAFFLFFLLIERIVRSPVFRRSLSLRIALSRETFTLAHTFARTTHAHKSDLPLKSRAYLHTWSSYLRRILGRTRHTVTRPAFSLKALLCMPGPYLRRWPLLNSSQPLLLRPLFLLSRFALISTALAVYSMLLFTRTGSLSNCTKSVITPYIKEHPSPFLISFAQQLSDSRLFDFRNEHRLD